MTPPQSRDIIGSRFGDNVSIYQGDVVHNHWNKSQEDEAAKCLSDLRITDPYDDKIRIESTKGGLLKDSYSWILEHGDFQQWRHDKGSRLLWIKGDPGKGKTMLLCGIIDELNSQHDSETLVSYFFCQAADSRINSATAVLRGLIYLAIKQRKQLIGHVLEKYKFGGETFFNDINSWTALSEIFSNILHDISLKQIIIIIDALDECTTDLPNLLNFIINHTKSAGSSQVKWIVSSRNWPEIEENLNSANKQTRLCLELNEWSISAAVNIYIKYKVEQLAQKKNYNPEIQKATQNYLSAQSNNTFLWVALVCENLEKFSLQNTLQRLKEFPPGLNSVYERMIELILRLEDADAKFCHQILAIVLLVYRPVTLAELGCLVKPLHDDAEPLHGDAAGAELIYRAIGLCGSFLTIKDEQVYIIHQSAKDYLTKAASTLFSPSLTYVHGIIFTQSLKAMSSILQRNMYDIDHLGFSIEKIKPPDPDPLKSLHYSCTHWANHFCDMHSNGQYQFKVDGEESQIALQFLRNHFLHWLEALGLIQCVEDGVLSMIRLEILLKENSLHNQVQELAPDIQRFHPVKKIKDLFKGKSSTRQLPDRHQSPDCRQSSDYQLLNFTQDSRRFIQQNNSVIANNPLQVYASGLIFAPSNSLIRRSFYKEEPKWLKVKPVVEYDWTPCLQTLDGHSDSVASVAFSTGSCLASGSDDGTIKIWDVVTGKERQTLRGHNGGIESIAFSIDGCLASGSDDGTIKIWDITTGREQQTLAGHGGRVTSVAFSTDGYLASGSNYGAIKIWDITTGKEQQTLAGHMNYVESLAFSIDGCLASGSRDKTIKIWDIKKGKERQLLTGHNDDVKSVTFSADGHYLASASGDETIKIWDITTGKEQQTLKGNSFYIESIAFLPGSRYLASAIDSTIKIWDITTGKEQRKLKDQSDISSIAVSDDGSYLASGLYNNTINIWDLTIKQEGQMFEGYGNFMAITLSTDGRYLASGSKDKIVRVWDTTTGKIHQTFRGHGNWVRSVAFSANDRYLASTSDDMTIKVWDIKKGKKHQTYQTHLEYGTSVAFSANNRYLASGLRNMIKVWDITTGKRQQTLVGHVIPFNLIVFSADSRYLASGPADLHIPMDSDNMTISIWDITTGKIHQTFKGHSSWIRSIAFSANGRYLASASEDKTLKIWDTTTGSELQMIEVNTVLHTISFDSTASYLHTEIGPIQLQMVCQATAAAQVISLDTNPVQDQYQHQRATKDTTKTIRNYFGYALSPDRCWITWGGYGILWLPPEYRPRVSATWPSLPFSFSQPASTDTVIALGAGSGRVVIMRMPGLGPYSML